MEFVKTSYLRVSDKAVLPVELYAVKLLGEPTGRAWLTKSHIKEMLELVQGTVVSYLDTYSEKKTSSTSKVQNKPSDIITGASVRVGYMFKDRPSHQTCLTDICNLMGTSHEGCSPQLQPLIVLKQKLLIYAHPLTGSSQGTSQLLKVMREKRDSMGGSEVSISNYFQRIPSSQTGSQRVANKSSQGPETRCTEPSKTQSNHPTSETTGVPIVTKPVPPEPASEGRKTRIKNILDRGKIGKKKKKGNITTKTSTCINTIDTKTKECPYNTVTNADMDSLSSIQEKYDIDSYCATSDLRITRVSTRAIDLDGSIPVDPILVENAENITISKTGDSVEPCGGLSIQPESHEDSSNQSDSSDCSFGLPSLNFPKKPSEDICSSENIGTQESEKLDLGIGQAEESSSPKFNPKRKMGQHDEDLLDGRQVSEKTNSEALKEKNEPEQCTVNKGLRRFAFKKRKLPKFSESDSESSVTQSKRSKTLVGKSGKSKKIPDFSSSDSDEIGNNVTNTKARNDSDNGNPTKQVPEKSQNAYSTRRSEEKFVNLNQMVKNSKKLKISNSFFTESDMKAQPTLSYFMSKGNKENSPLKQKRNSDAERASDDTEDLDCELIMEMCAIPRVKNEKDVTLREEVKEIRHIENLNEDHLQYMVRNNESYLRQIFEGKVHCERHEAYKKGGMSRQDLNYNSRIARFTDEQVEAVMEALQTLFCKRHNKYLDYLIKVLLPEMLVKIHMDIHDTSHWESEKLLAHAFHPTLYHTDC